MTNKVGEGSVHGKLTVVSEYKGKDRVRKHWVCLCDCGREMIVKDNSLKTGNTSSCGCARAIRNIKHGLSSSKFYESWCNMKRRCDSENNDYYANYGGRGITYDSRWKSFECFKRDMYSEYKEGLSLERIDVNGNYSKDNCKWIPLSEQAKNKGKPSNNTSGFCGVRAFKRSGRVTSYVARWVSEGKAKSKHFSVKKLGEECAYKLACEYRQEKIDYLGYGENHGK